MRLVFLIEYLVENENVTARFNPTITTIDNTRIYIFAGITHYVEDASHLMSCIVVEYFLIQEPGQWHATSSTTARKYCLHLGRQKADDATKVTSLHISCFLTKFPNINQLALLLHRKQYVLLCIWF